MSESAKMKKQLGFADKKNVAFASLIDENEMATDMQIFAAEKKNHC